LDSLAEQITDYRLYEKQDVASVLLFGFHAVDFLHMHGYEYRGHNIKDMGWCFLLVVKATLEDTPLVAFINERTPAHCMRVFIRRLEEKRVKWQEDKFA
jgi:hypothetical protein